MCKSVIVEPVFVRDEICRASRLEKWVYDLGRRPGKVGHVSAQSEQESVDRSQVLGRVDIDRDRSRKRFLEPAGAKRSRLEKARR